MARHSVQQVISTPATGSRRARGCQCDDRHESATARKGVGVEAGAMVMRESCLVMSTTISRLLLRRRFRICACIRQFLQWRGMKSIRISWCGERSSGTVLCKQAECAVCRETGRRCGRTSSVARLTLKISLPALAGFRHRDLGSATPGESANSLSMSTAAVVRDFLRRGTVRSRGDSSSPRQCRHHCSQGC